jgi:asparagine synthase (glutamine-hydrolysing)
MPSKTFTVGFERENGGDVADKFDETKIAAEFSESLGIPNHTKMLTAEECFAALPDIQYHMDVPQANPSSVPLWFLAKEASKNADVVFSGEGADELFAGYELYASTPAMVKFKKLPLFLRRMMGAIAKKMPPFKGRNFLMKCAERPAEWFIGQADIFSAKETGDLLTAEYKNAPTPKQMTAPYFAKVASLSEVNQKQYVDMHLWMPGDILVKADRMSMAHSLTVRTPILDIEIMRLAQSIPSRYNVSGAKGKVSFRAAAGKTLPEEWAKRPKKGFPVPIRNWLRQEKWYTLVKEAFTSECAKEFFNTATLEALLDEHYRGNANNGRKIWTVYTFLVWYKRYFVDEAA